MQAAHTIQNQIKSVKLVEERMEKKVETALPFGITVLRDYWKDP